jgi:hypothetical protein
MRRLIYTKRACSLRNADIDQGRKESGLEADARRGLK